MTDKQIIIDGVDVRKCVNRRWDNSQKIHLCYDSDTPLTSWGWCENNPNCYYKQLKAKEQECEELRSLLKVRIEDLCDSCGASSMMPMPCKVYEKTLAEIKEIANRLEQTKIPFAAIAEQIKDKIEEVENE